MKRAFVLIKPDAIERGLIGQIVSRFESKGLKLMQLDERLMQEHYAHLVDKPSFPDIHNFVTSTPVVAAVWGGLDWIDIVRGLTDITNARKAEPGTIRGDFGMNIQKNLVHASDGRETAKAEVARFFADEELQAYCNARTDTVYADDEANS